MTIEHQYHQIANILPLMTGDEYETFKTDIRENGLREPICLHSDGRIIDGRNRYRACKDLGIEPEYFTWEGEDDDILSYVRSQNLHRRHLTSSQRAAVAVDCLAIFQEQAKERQRLSGKHCGRGQERSPNDLGNLFDGGEAAKKAAKEHETNHDYVSKAKKLKQEAPELFKDVKMGARSVPNAMREYVKRQKIEAPPLPRDGKYSIFYVDPPWKYGNSGVIGTNDNYGHVERHYPSMSIDELCTLPVREMCEPNAVLFLWVTSPLLEEAFRVINAWGFKYKTSFVWDKVGHNFGHYNSVRHEFLLVCTRGSMTPQVKELVPSVQSIAKTQKHSEKPEEFRKIIDKLYPHGNRIELFARASVTGWDSWGNEPNDKNSIGMND